MNLLENTSIDDIIKERLTFISKISGKELTSLEVQKSKFAKGAEQFNHTLNFSLDNKYFIQIIDILNYLPEWSIWKKEVEFSITSQNKKIYEEQFSSTTNIPGGHAYDISESKLQKEINETIKSRIGGIYVEAVPLYDYESFTFNDFTKEHVYGANLYRIILALMKDEGKLLPPMLIKEPLITELMENGEVQKLDDLLLSKISSLGREYEQFAFDHMIFERNKIQEYAEHKKEYLDPSIPLSKKATNLAKVFVPGETYKDKINILVIEDFPDFLEDNGSLGILAEKMSVDLAKTHMFDGATIYRTVNLSECMWLCNTGQIQLIVADGKGDKLSQAMEYLNKNNISIQIKQGDETLNPDVFDGSKEKIMWINRIYDSLEEKDLPKPAHIILPKNFMDIDLATLIKGMLPVESKFSVEEDLLINKHLAELTEVFDIQKDADLACHRKDTSEYMNSTKSYMDKRPVQKILLDQKRRWAEGAVAMGENLSKEQFDMTLYSFINQNVPDNFEHATPYALMEGLQKIDIITTKYEEYMSDKNIRLELYNELNTRLFTSVRQLQDTSYFTMCHQNLGILSNLVANTYVLLKKMNEYNKEEFFSLNKEKAEDQRNIGDSVEELVDRTIFYSLAIASSLKRDDRTNDMSEFLVKYSKKIAEVSNAMPSFNHNYKRLFEASD